jgi:hypothetical protein
MQAHNIRKIQIARYLLDMATDQVRSHRAVALFASVNLVQDALEVFLIAASDHLGVTLSNNATFEQRYDSVNSALEGKLSLRGRLIQINKIRVNAKHYAIRPDQSEAETAVDDARRFIEDASDKIFGVPYTLINFVDDMRECEEKTILQSAQKLLLSGDFSNTMIECRKAFYVAFESRSDISVFLPGSHNRGLLSFFRGMDAPYFAQNKDYAEKNVREPFDYIVLDHAKLEARLLRDGIDTIAFWNVWRMTPAVYKDTIRGWLVRHEQHKLEGADIEQRAHYVFDNTVDMIRASQIRQAQQKSALAPRYTAKIKTKEAPVYERASINAKVVTHIPADIQEIEVEYSTPAIDGSEQFWRTNSFFGAVSGRIPGANGYILETDLDIGGL